MRRVLAVCLLALWPGSVWAAVSYVASASNAGNPTNTFTMTIPSGTTTDDVLIVAVLNGGDGSDPTVVDNDTGGNTWTEISNGNDGTQAGQSTWWKRATSATASKTITVTVAGTRSAGTVSVYRGVTTASPPYEAKTQEANLVGDHAHASITSTVDGSVVILSVVISAVYTCAGTMTVGSLTGSGEVQGLTNVGLGGCVDTIGFAKATAGASGAGGWTEPGGGSNTNSTMFVLKPAAGAAPTRWKLLTR